MIRYALRKVHCSLIRLLVGRSSIAINVDVIDGGLMIKSGPASFASGCCVTNSHHVA